MFYKNNSKENARGYFLKLGVQYPENLQTLHNDVLFLPERLKFEKIKQLVANLHDKIEYVIHIRNLKQALNRVSFGKIA